MARRELTCACCGGAAGRFQQWHNQDKGFGICARCIAWMRQPTSTKPVRESEAAIRDYYGVEGVNYAPSEARQYRIETLQSGQWLWVILPPFRAKAEAEMYAVQMQERSASGASYRVVED
jgi:hypothetical protein